MSSLETQVARLQTLARLNRLVSACRDIDRSLGEIARTAAELTGADLVALWVADEATRTLHLRASSDDALRADHPVPALRFGEGGIGWVAEHQRSLPSDDLLTDTRFLAGEWLRKHGFRSGRATPIVHEGETLGVLAMLGRAPSALAGCDQEMLDGFVAQAAVAIRNARIFAESEARRRVAEALAEVGQTIAQSFDPTFVAHRITESVCGLLGARSAAIYGLDPGSGALALQAVSGNVGQTFHWTRELPPGTGLVALALDEGCPIASADVVNDARVVYTPEARAAVTDATHRAVMAVPLLARDRALGVLAIGGLTGRVFTPEEMRIAQAFASQAVLTLENARLVEDAERRRREAEFMATLSSEINASLELPVILERVAEGARDLCRADAAVIALREPHTETFFVRHQRGAKSVQHMTDPITAGKGAGGLVLTTGRPFRTDDYARDPRITADYREWAGRDSMVAAMVVPILGDGRTEGLLYVHNRSPRAFSDRDEGVLSRLADHAAIAIKNAGLFEETERRRLVAEVLAGLAQQINACLDLDTILARVSTAARDLCHADMSWIALTDRDSGETVLQHWPGALGAGYAGTRIVPGEDMGGWVLLSGQPFRTADYANDPRLVRRSACPAVLEGVVTALVVPIQIVGRTEGLLCVENRSPRPFGAQDEATLVQLAEHTAVAVQNARLLDDLKSRQIRLETLLDVSREMSQIQPVESLLRTIARACGRVLDTNSVGLRLVEGDELVVAGGSSDLDEHLTPRLKLGESACGIVATTGLPLAIDDVSGDPRVVPSHREALRRLGYRSLLGVPLKVGERVVGVLSIRARRSGGFSKQDQAIAAAFAAQAATALENARLFQEVQRAYTEVSRAQQDLIQAQKMDAIGQLAGGMAHDFNNLLTIVNGRAEILRRRLGEHPKARQDIDAIQRTAVRAAALTRQLLAFSRKQVLQPKVLSLNRAVADASAMCRRLIGEDIDLVLDLGAADDRVQADPTQLEQILINLALNSRDAMPQGGRLAVETTNAELDGDFVRRHPGARPGLHVKLAVSDAGLGMSEEVQAHAFEPFFTTKEKGKGTGLGLATVYGIVKQHDGYIELKSAPGEGTIVSIYLPCVQRALTRAETGGAATGTPGGQETILLVEDEDEVRELAREILETNGYTVIDAASGMEALQVCRQRSDPIHLVLTDVVMPGMSGRELARWSETLRPQARVVYMSGYTDDALGRHGVLEPGVVLLEKPFTPESLLNTIRTALD